MKGGNLMEIKKIDIFLFILILLCITPLFLPDYFFRYKLLDNIINSSILIILIVFIFLNLLYIKKINLFVIFSFLFFVWRYYSSHIISNGITDMNNLICTFAIILVSNFFLNKNISIFLNCMFILFSLLIFINFMTQIVYTNGLYIDNPRINQYRPAWIFGIDNAFTYYILPMISVIVFRSIYLFNKLTLPTIIITIISITSIIWAHSATAIVSMALFLILIFCYKFKIANKLINFINLTIIYIIIWILVIRVNSYETFEYFIVDILGKDLTFSGRTRIWNVAFEVIKEELWFGHGIGYAFKVSYTYFVAHNQFLQLTIESGLIGLILFLIILAIVGYILQLNSMYKESFIILGGIFMFFFAGLTEAYQYRYIFLLFTIGYNLRGILIKKEENRYGN